MLPVLFTIGSFKLHTWGLLLLIGFFVAVSRAARMAPRYGFTRDALWDCSLIGLLGGVIGGRLAYVAQNIPYFTGHPGEILAVWTGGMTSFGGFLGGIAAGLLAARKRGMNVADAADLAAPSLAIGYFFGRIGCLLNGCCYGRACALPWAIHFHPDGQGDTGAVHPTQLYSALAAAVIFVVLRFLEPRRAFKGQLILVFAILYGIYRFVVEFWREGATAEIALAHLTSGQLASLAVSLIATGLYLVLARRRTA
jgi:phosphatidylglycerol:prolipoprotein diacylglycerol transferase